MIKWINTNVEVRQGCVVSEWLYNAFMDVALCEMRVRCVDYGMILNHGKMEVVAVVHR